MSFYFTFSLGSGRSVLTPVVGVVEQPLQVGDLHERGRGHDQVLLGRVVPAGQAVEDVVVTGREHLQAAGR